MLQSKGALYGVLAVVEVAKRQANGAAGVQAHEVARTFSLPDAYCAKVMSQLARAGVLVSGRGPRGGFRLAADPEQVTLLDIMDAVQQALISDNRPVLLDAPPALIQATHTAVERASQAYCRELQKVTVADLMKS